MIFSFSALLSTLAFSSTMILIQIVLLKKMRIDQFLSATFLMIVSLIFIIRLCFPGEFFFTKTLPSKVVLPFLDSVLEKNIFNFRGLTFTTINLLVTIWLIGCVIYFIRFCLIINNVYRIKRLFSKSPTFYFKGKKVIMVDEKISPVVIGFFNPFILLPNLDISDRQREFILDHELFHISSFDIWIKHFYEVLSIIYWWNPVIHIFRNSFNQIIELKADEGVVARLNDQEKIEYVETLLNVGLQINRNNYRKKIHYCPSFVASDHNSLVVRANSIFSQRKTKPYKFLVLLFSIICFYFSSCIIFEPYFVDPKVENTTISIDEESSFLVKMSNEKYKVYDNGAFLFEVSDEDRINMFPNIKVFKSIKDGENYVKKNY